MLSKVYSSIPLLSTCYAVCLSFYLSIHSSLSYLILLLYYFPSVYAHSSSKALKKYTKVGTLINVSPVWVVETADVYSEKCVWKGSSSLV